MQGLVFEAFRLRFRDRSVKLLRAEGVSSCTAVCQCTDEQQFFDG